MSITKKQAAEVVQSAFSVLGQAVTPADMVSALERGGYEFAPDPSPIDELVEKMVDFEAPHTIRFRIGNACLCECVGSNEDLINFRRWAKNLVLAAKCDRGEKSNAASAI